MGTGDPDLYKGFTWRFWSLINYGAGRMGVVLPRSVFSSKGSADFRRETFSSGIVEDLTNLLNRQRWVFDEVHAQYLVTLFCLKKLKSDAGTTLAIRGPYSSKKDLDAGKLMTPVQFTLQEVFSWTATAALPLLPDDFAAEIFAQLRRAPNLDYDDKTGWRTRPYRELDATNDKKYMEMTGQPEADWWPVYGGESFKIWQPDTGKYKAWAKPERVLKRLLSKRARGHRNKRSVFFEFTKAWVDDESTYPTIGPRIAFHDVTNSIDYRTVMSSLIPPNVVVQNSAPILLWPRGDEKG